MLPDIDGFEVSPADPRQAARCPRAPPVIILSARGAELDRVRGFELGADDYVTKPFSLMELLARVARCCGGPRARRPAEPIGLRFGDIEIDLVGQVAMRAGQRGGAGEPRASRDPEGVRAVAGRGGEPRSSCSTRRGARTTTRTRARSTTTS